MPLEMKHGIKLIADIMIPSAVIALTALSCGVSREEKLRRDKPQLSISMTGEDRQAVDTLVIANPKRDTLQIYDMDGKPVIIMEAVRDEESGEMVAHEVLDAAVITARFRNVAERHGKVDIEFDITVPQSFIEHDWQSRFYPDMFMLGDSTRLDMLIVTGLDYRKAQLKGYQRYNDFIAKIVTDTTKFINVTLLERFLQRNIPQVYAFKTDSTEVSEEQFASVFGVTEKQAIEHYTDHIGKYLNNRRISKRDAMYRKYVKAPIITDNVRLDTVFTTVDGDFTYHYVQTIDTRPKLRQVDVVVSGEVYQQDKLLYYTNPTEPLTFYISSVSAFVDNTERYLTKVIERRAEANASCHIAFEQGKWDLKEGLSDNRRQIRAIKTGIRDVLLNEKFDLDSITVRSWASPEGSVRSNKGLSDRRARAVRDYFNDYMAFVQDSLELALGTDIHMDENGRAWEENNYKRKKIRILSSSGGENWASLDRLVISDSTLSQSSKEYYFKCRDIRNLDEGERQMRRDAALYSRLRELYPELRSVDFTFNMHRKGMVKDTVHTTELDTVYMNAVQAIRDHDYEVACEALAPYQDYNTAVAYVALDRNQSALRILEPMERTPQVNYMLALIYSRMGDEQKAVQCYLHACQQDGSYVFRGNLDPEIARLIKKYGLNKQEDDDELTF